MSRLLEILLCFQILQNIWSVACNLVVFSNIALLVASNWRAWILPVEHCLFGGFNRLNFHCFWHFCGTFKNRNHWVAATTLAFPRGLQSCGILEHCHIFGVFNNSNISSRLKILLYFQIWQNIGWLQELQFPPVASNPVVFSNIAKYLVASKNKKFCSFLTILLYFQILPNIGRLQNIGGLQ